MYSTFFNHRQERLGNGPGGVEQLPDNHLTAEDLGATLTGFSISLVAALKLKNGNEVLETLANELHDLAQRAPNTPAADAMDAAARMLMASEPQ